MDNKPQCTLFQNFGIILTVVFFHIIECVIEDILGESVVDAGLKDRNVTEI